MITLLMLFVLVTLIAFMVAVITGLVAIAPALLVIVAFVFLDAMLFKLVFRRKKKEK